MESHYSKARKLLRIQLAVSFIATPLLMHPGAFASPDCSDRQYLLLSKLAKLIDHHDGRAALAIATQNVTKSPTDACSYAVRARLYCQIDENEAALSDASKALAIAPQHVLALTTKAVSLMRLNRTKEALALTDKALSLKPDNPYVVDDRIEILVTSRHIEEAKLFLEKLIAKDPRDAVKRGRYIRVLVGEKNHEKVIEHTSIVLQQYPKSPNGFYVLSMRGDAYRRLGKLGLAERDYLNAQKLNAHCLDSYRGLIEIYKTTKNQSALAKQKRLLKEMEEDF